MDQAAHKLPDFFTKIPKLYLQSVYNGAILAIRKPLEDFSMFTSINAAQFYFSNYYFFTRKK